MNGHQRKQGNFFEKELKKLKDELGIMLASKFNGLAIDFSKVIVN